MDIQYKTVKSHSFNEDRFVISNKIFGVIDGATGLSGNTKGKKTTASKLSAFLKSKLERYNGENIEEYIENLSKESYEKNLYPATCGISLAVIKESVVQFYFVGDCDIFCKLKNGEVRSLKQTRLGVLDGIAVDAMKKIAQEKNISIKSARPLINDVLIKHRNMVNKPNGYFAFEPQQNPNFKPTILEIDKEEIDRIIICTDGYSQCFTTLEILKDYKSLFEEDLNEVLNEIVKVSREDKDYNKYPRFKIIDDITYVSVKF